MIQTCTFADCSAIFFLLLKSTFIILLRQCSSQSDPTSATQQAQLLLEEKQQLEMHNHQVCAHECQAAAIASAVLIPFFIRFTVVAAGVHRPSADREGSLCRTDPGGGSGLEGQNRTVAYTGRLYTHISGSLVLTGSEAKRIISVSVQVALVAEERDQNIGRVQELEAAITELRSAAGKTFKCRKSTRPFPC